MKKSDIKEPWKKEGERYAGEVFVDSGFVALHCPSRPVPAKEKKMRALMEKEAGGVCSGKSEENVSDDDIMLVSSGIGDGSYPVYVKYDKETGRVRELRMVFMHDGKHVND